MKEGRKEGKKEGMKEGRKEGKKEVKKEERRFVKSKMMALRRVGDGGGGPLLVTGL